jgi:hypothetical protein
MVDNVAVVVIRVCLLAAAIAAPQVEPARAPLVLRSPLQDKIFYLLSLIERTATPELKREPALARIAQAKRESLAHAVQTCAADVACYAAAMRFTDPEVDAVRVTLRTLCERNPAVRRFVEGPIRRSGIFARYPADSDADLLARGWVEAATGINRAIDVYALGHPPRYVQIDSPTHDVRSAAYGHVVQIAAAVLEDRAASLDFFFEPSLEFALELLRANHRDEAGRHEPLEAGENRSAVRRISKIRWGEYPYSVIIVPGSGPDRDSVALSSIGRMRLELAVKRYRERKAPLILVSGGYVHPDQTRFNEALEMKKALLAEFAIPESAILVDPQARHTTTNLRNAARLLYRYGVPFQKTAVITTDQLQSTDIESEEFRKRCDAQMGYQPGRVLRRVSAFDLEFQPAIESLQVDSTDLLDP